MARDSQRKDYSSKTPIEHWDLYESNDEAATSPPTGKCSKKQVADIKAGDVACTAAGRCGIISAVLKKYFPETKSEVPMIVMDRHVAAKGESLFVQAPPKGDGKFNMEAIGIVYEDSKEKDYSVGILAQDININTNSAYKIDTSGNTAPKIGDEVLMVSKRGDLKANITSVDNTTSSFTFSPSRETTQGESGAPILLARKDKDGKHPLIGRHLGSTAMREGLAHSWMDACNSFTNNICPGHVHTQPTSEGPFTGKYRYGNMDAEGLIRLPNQSSDQLANMSQGTILDSYVMRLGVRPDYETFAISALKAKYKEGVKFTPLANGVLVQLPQTVYTPAFYIPVGKLIYSHERQVYLNDMFQRLTSK